MIKSALLKSWRFDQQNYDVMKLFIRFHSQYPSWVSNEWIQGLLTESRISANAGFTGLVKGKIPYLPFNGLGYKGAKCIVFSVFFLSDKGLNEQ